jgi:16S rRNA (guanine966-N2)-methyltransferase
MSVHRFLQDKAAQQYHFIYIDPPYDVDDVDVIETLIQLRDGGYLHPQALIAVERNSRVKEISWPEGLEALREKNYGQATIFYGVPTLADSENG